MMTQRVAYLMELIMWAGVHQDGSTGGPNKPCQSLLIRLGLNAMPKEMAVFYTLANERRWSLSVSLFQM